VTAVTKVTCGMPQVARALTASGISQLGESRLENVHRLRAGGISAPVMLLRIPPLSAAEEIVRTVDVSLNSELPVISRLSEVAQSLGIVHDIILMVDLGDLREGIWPEDLMSTVARVRELEGVRIAGIGTNLTCYGGVIPTEKNLGRLVDYAKRIEDRFGFRIETISGGNSSSLELAGRRQGAERNQQPAYRRGDPPGT
jgi:predicted amino acid racemase